MSTATAADALDVCNPADGRLIATVPVDDRETVNGVAADLRCAQVGWVEAGPRQRARWLHRWRDWILAHTDELTDLLQAETGKVRPDALVETTASCEFITYYADNAERFLAGEQVRSSSLLSLPKRLSKTYHPYPVVGLITPWNFPITLFLMDAAPALAAGCAVLAKSSEETPLTCARVVDGLARDRRPSGLGPCCGCRRSGCVGGGRR